MTWFLIAVVLVVALGTWLSWTASRLDTLHHRVELARESVHRRLLERSGWTLELAASGLLDDASGVVLADAAALARSATEEDFEGVESDLSQALRLVLDPPTVPRDATVELAAACHRVELSRRFHNDLIASAKHLRGRRRARWFRLAGRAGPLRTIDFDDSPPQSLVTGATDSGPRGTAV